MTDLLPYGMGTPDLVEFQPGYFVDRAIVGDLQALAEDAKANGLSCEWNQLTALSRSSFRFGTAKLGVSLRFCRRRANRWNALKTKKS